MLRYFFYNLKLLSNKQNLCYLLLFRNDNSNSDLNFAADSYVSKYQKQFDKLHVQWKVFQMFCFAAVSSIQYCFVAISAIQYCFAAGHSFQNICWYSIFDILFHNFCASFISSSGLSIAFGSLKNYWRAAL